jgi:hypothetical protein
MHGQGRVLLPRQDSGVQTNQDYYDDDDVFPRGHRSRPALPQRAPQARANGVPALSATFTSTSISAAATLPSSSSASVPLSLESLSATNTILTTELAHLRAAHHALQATMKAASPSGLEELHHQLRTPHNTVFTRDLTTITRCIRFFFFHVTCCCPLVVIACARSTILIKYVVLGFTFPSPVPVLLFFCRGGTKSNAQSGCRAGCGAVIA